MKMNVKLFGAFATLVYGYNAKKGINVDLPDGSTALDLIEALDLPHKKTAFVSIDNRLVKPETVLHESNTVRIIQAASGG